MTRSTRRWQARDEQLRAAALSRRCPDCGAKPGDRCWSRYNTGERVTYVHEGRMRR